MNYKKGFTLIELLVVIAIIGLLSSIVLASLRSASNKGGNAAVKSNLANIRAEATLHYENNNGLFTTVCSNAKVVAMWTAAREVTGATTITSPCFANANAWAISAPLKTQENGLSNWCVDSTGASRPSGVAVSTVCP